MVRRLLAGETLVWLGRPQQGWMLAPHDAFKIPLSIVVAGFSFVWEFMALLYPLPWFFPVFGSFFVVMSLFLLVGRYMVDAWARGYLTYGLTSGRALIDRGGPWPRLHAIPLHGLSEISLQMRSEGRGTITFGPNGADRHGRHLEGIMLALDATPRFIGIAGAESVFDNIQRSIASR